MSNTADNSSDLTTDAEPINPCNVESLKISSDEEKREPSPKPKERRKSSTSKPNNRPRRPDSSSNVMMNFVNSQDIHIGNTFTLVADPNAAPDFMRSTSALKKTQEIKELMSSKDIISKEEIVWLSTHIGKGWRKVGILLEYSEGQLDQFEEDYSRRGIRETIYQMLLDWKNARLEEEAKVGIVSKAMWKAKEREAVQRWAYRRGKPVPPSSA